MTIIQSSRAEKKEKKEVRSAVIDCAENCETVLEGTAEKKHLIIHLDGETFFRQKNVQKLL